MENLNVIIVGFDVESIPFIQSIKNSDNFNIIAIIEDKQKIKKNCDKVGLGIDFRSDIADIVSNNRIDFIIVIDDESKKLLNEIELIAPSTSIILNKFSAKKLFDTYAGFRKEILKVGSAYNLSKSYSALLEDSNKKLDGKLLELSLLNEASRVFSSSAFDQRNIASFIYKLLKKKISFSILLLYLIEGDKKLVILASEKIISKNSLNEIVGLINSKIANSNNNNSFNQNDFVLLQDIVKLSDKQSSPLDSKIKDIYEAPIVIGETILGHLAMILCETDNITDDDRNFFSIITNQVALFIENDRIKQIITNERNQLDSILQNMFGVLLVVDNEKNIILTNPMVDFFWDISKTSIQKQKINEIAFFKELDGLIDELQRSDEKSITRDIQLTSTKIADLIDVRAGLSKVYNFLGDSLGVVLILNDISREKEIERMKTEFVSVASHELRSPLSSIKQSISLIQEQMDPSAIEIHGQYLGIASRNVDRLLNIVNNLLDISRIESGKMELDIEKISINAIIKDVIMNFTLLSEKKKINLKGTLDTSLLFIEADALKISEVVTNLISNAIKFTQDYGSIEIKTSMYELDNSFVKVSVSDTGQGIGKEDFDKVFSKFERISNPAYKHVGGTGLGMAITKGIIEMHKGKIWIESTIGKGSTFHFILPI